MAKDMVKDGSKEKSGMVVTYLPAGASDAEIAEFVASVKARQAAYDKEHGITR
jgi:hypothetical protein